jgi:hypothetical protein
MHFRLPKPLHGWREFAGEVGIIVVGVLIALGAEQVVETIHWQRTIDNERKALDSDVADAWNAMTARLVIQRCVDDRLNDLALVLGRHDRGEPLGIFAPIGRPSVWTASESALQMASADGSLSHMSLKSKQFYFGVRENYEAFAPVADEERTSWRELEALNDAGGLDQTDWRDLRKAYRDAVDSNHVMKSNLVIGTPGQWLTVFREFPPLPKNEETLSIPWVQELCRPAVKR